MTKKIKCIILSSNRGIRTKKVSSNVPYFKHLNKLYTIPLEAVNLTCCKGVMNPTPELIFIENDPLPITVSIEGDASSFLEALVMKRVLEMTGKPKGAGLSIVMEYLRSPAKLFMLVIVIIIAVSFILGIQQGGI